MARLIPVHGDVVEINGGKEVSLEEMQKIVGGFIESVTLIDGRVIIIGEEAKFSSHEINHVATMLAARVISKTDYIAGDAILFDREELK